MLNMDQYIQFLNQTDNVVLKAVEVLEKGEAFPVAPEKENITAQEENEQEERTA